MKRSAKVCWIGFVFSTIVIAAVAGLVIYFTAFKRSDDPILPVGVVSSENSAAGTPSGSSSDALPTGTSLVDHLSHSVPGFEYKQVDFNGDGVEQVQLDGSRSHTHYYDEGPPIVIGKLVQMTWFNKNTRDKIADGAKPLVSFPVGTTEVGLTVVDNYRDSHTDYATVIVEPPLTDGAYCYYYPSAPNLRLADALDDGEKPTFATHTDQIAFSDDSEFPEAMRGTQFQMRCVFIVPGGSRSFSVNHFGPVRLLVGDAVVLESASKDESVTTGSITLPEGDHTVHVLYARTSSAAGKLEVDDGLESRKYDRSRVLPVIRNISPPSTTLDGGGTAKITGIGLLNGVIIRLGDKEVEIDEEMSSNSEVTIVVPASSTSGIVSVTATNAVGTSNPLTFTYSTTGLPPIKFREGRLMDGGAAFEIPLLTGIKYGPDHRYYATSINNRVHSFAADRSMQVTDPCVSSPLGEDRAILGLAFNPADTEFKLYVSASVLDWKREEKISTPNGWGNGQILLVQKDIDGACLGVSGDPVITGLPVSNHDHGVNGIEFDQEGKLHIQVGGFTNAGINDDSSRLGGFDENPLSAASLVADINKSGFDGKITYSSTDAGAATQTGGDVRVYSSGWRNSFGIAIHSNGFLYATDNGASVGFGDMSLTCKTQERQAGKNLADKLGKVIDGKYTGHPNRNRGRKDSRECEFKGSDEPSTSHYLAPIATFESSTDGVIEYTARTFGGQLKGNILCSKYSTQDSPGKVFRVRLNGNGDLASGPDEMWPASGLSIQMSPWGQILMPRVYKREIMMLTPVGAKASSVTLIAVMPFRGPASGGNEVIVTGENFTEGAVAVFGGKRCTEATAVSADGSSFKCKVPPGQKGQRVSVALEFSDSAKNAAAGEGTDYWYMNV